MIRFLALASVLTVASGCASSSLPLSPPATLAEVNTVLDGRKARVVLSDGTELATEEVVLSETQTTFVRSDTGDTLSIATDRLAQVSVGLPRSRLAFLGRSVTTGAAPGLLTTGVGLAWLIADLRRTGAYVPSLGPVVVIAGGVFLLASGTAAGLFHGVALAPTKWVVVYPYVPDS